MYYILTGGHVVQLFRTPDFMSWEESSLAPFIYPSIGDGLISPYNGSRNFLRPTLLRNCSIAG